VSQTFGRLLKRSPSSLQIGAEALNVARYSPRSSSMVSRSGDGSTSYAGKSETAAASNVRSVPSETNGANGSGGSYNGARQNGGSGSNGVSGPSWLTASINGDVYTLAESISSGGSPRYLSVPCGT
jgi:hypothetical protein